MIVKLHSRELCYYYEHTVPCLCMGICSIFQVFLVRVLALADTVISVMRILGMRTHGSVMQNFVFDTKVVYICVCQVQVWPAFFHWGNASMNQSIY